MIADKPLPTQTPVADQPAPGERPCCLSPFPRRDSPRLLSLHGLFQSRPGSLPPGPYLQHDPDLPADVLKINTNEEGLGGDDPADGLRYLVATSIRRINQVKLRGL